MMLVGLPLIMGALVLQQQTVVTKGDKILPVLQKNAYTAMLEVNIMDKNYKNYAIEKYDYMQRKAMIILIDPKKDTAKSFTFDYGKQVTNGLSYSSWSRKIIKECAIMDMADSEINPKMGLRTFFHYFGGWSSIDNKGKPEMFPPKNIFSLKSKNKFVYNGTVTIDGVPADSWTSRITWSDKATSDDFIISYYFTQSGWRTATSTGSKVFPLRIQIDGTKTAGGNKKPIHHYYDYISFETMKSLPASVFAIPDVSTACINYKTETQKMPKIPESMSYIREVIDGNGNVDISRVIYNKKEKFFRIASNTKTVLYDYANGVHYESSTVKCLVRAFNSTKDYFLSNVQEHIQPNVPPEFISLTKTMFAGQRKSSRLIDTNVWVGTANNSKFDIQFATPNWKFAGNHPKSVVLSMNRDGKHYNFFNYKASSSELISSQNLIPRQCQTSDNEEIKVNFILSSNSYIDGNVFLEKENAAILVSAIAKNAGLHFVQVSYVPYFSFWNSQTSILSLDVMLIPPPPPQYLYRISKQYAVENGNTFIVKTVSLSGNKQTVIQKASKLCEDTTACTNFDLCESNANSFKIIMYKFILKESFKPSTSCDHFARSVKGDAEPSLKKALSRLQGAITKGALSVNAMSRVLIATDFQRYDYRNLAGDTNSVSEKFDWVFDSKVKTRESLNSVTSDNDCASHCLSRTEYECKAFTYCYFTNTCILSSESPIKGQSDGGCFVKIRKYIADFQAMPGKTINSESKYIYQSINDENGCAMKCEQNKNVKCESFDYCSKTKRCMLSKTHFYGVPANKIQQSNPSCTHYSRNKLMDFTITINTEMKSRSGTGFKTVADTDPTKCAYLCESGQAGQGCFKFDYCSDRKVCQFVSTSNDKDSYHSVKLGCDTYTSSTLKLSSMQKQSSVSYSSSAFGGLAFGMVLLGLILGTLIIFVLYKKSLLNLDIKV